jgi:hypothetical protein
VSRIKTTENNADGLKPVNIGFGNFLFANRIVGVFNPDSAPMKRLVAEAKERKQLVDATQGRRTRAVIVTDCGYVVLSSIQPETVSGRI